MNRNKPSKQPRPSYEEGELRDPRIEEMQDKDFTRDDFLRIIKKAAASGNAPQKPLSRTRKI